MLKQGMKFLTSIGNKKKAPVGKANDMIEMQSSDDNLDDSSDRVDTSDPLQRKRGRPKGGKNKPRGVSSSDEEEVKE